MSRIGKKPVEIPTGVTVTVAEGQIKVKGPKGALQVVLHDDVSVAMDKNAVKVAPRHETKRARSQWGTSRTLVSNLISGVTKGFEEKLEITGVGYRAAVQGKNLQLALGYSHDVTFPIPSENGPAPAPDVKGEWFSLDQTFVMEPGKARLPKPPAPAPAPVASMAADSPERRPKMMARSQ